MTREKTDTSDEACAVACMLVSNPLGELRSPGWQKRVNDLIRALRDERNASPPARHRVRHKKRGSTYRVIGRGELQSSSPTEEGAMLVAYRCEADGRLWIRPANEFDDGRFETLDDAE